MTALTLWQPLHGELEAWRRAGRQATLWWRNDGVGAPEPALEHLLTLAEGYRVPLALAVVPGRASRELRGLMPAHPRFHLLQHGIEHKNRAPAPGAPLELGGPGNLHPLMIGLAGARARLEALASRRALPVLVPPWDRLDARLLDLLPQLGYRGLSAWGPRPSVEAAEGLRQVNVHADAMLEQGAFRGGEAVLQEVVGHLQMRRTGQANADEPTGLRTRHALHDAACWDFLERLLEETVAHPAVTWLAAPDVFGLGPEVPRVFGQRRPPA